ncbi:MAG: ferrous iron transport protein B [bacterium]
MANSSSTPTSRKTYEIAICGNPNCGKTTIFNGITGLSQHVANYPGVTVEKVTGKFTGGDNNNQVFTLVDIPGTYSLSAFSPDEDIAVSALIGRMKEMTVPDVIICVIDATNLERGLSFLLQVMEIERPMVVAVNMMDLAKRRGLIIDCDKMSEMLGGIKVIPVVGNKKQGIDALKKATIEAIGTEPPQLKSIYDVATEKLIQDLAKTDDDHDRCRAEYIRVIFDVGSPAEKRFLAEESEEVHQVLLKVREELKKTHTFLSMAESSALTFRANEIFEETVTSNKMGRVTTSEKVDKVLLHWLAGPILLFLTMMLVFQSIFSWSEPLMDLIDSLFGSLAGVVEASMAEGPLRSLLTDGIIGGVGSVLIFLPQIIILFLFIAILEDSGYMSRAAFLVDRLFKWCGLSGKSFIPMLSSFACAIPGILATRTIEDRKLRFITIMIAPLMTCSARLPVYAIMIAAFIPYKIYFGFLNLQGIVLTLLYLLGLFVAVIVSYILKKIIFKAETGSFLMELPSYKVPSIHSVFVRVLNRAKAFILRAGTVILAITVIIWALGYFPRDKEIHNQYLADISKVEADHQAAIKSFNSLFDDYKVDMDDQTLLKVNELDQQFAAAATVEDIVSLTNSSASKYPELAIPIGIISNIHMYSFITKDKLMHLTNDLQGKNLRNSYFARIGKVLEPIFHPLGWDWKITMATLAAFPAREVIIATIGTIYNLGANVDEESTSLVEKMRQAKWEDGPKMGSLVFTPSVALSIMVFFALCCQCGATLVTIRKETASWWYSVGTFAYMTSLAYLLSFATFQIFSRIWY